MLKTTVQAFLPALAAALLAAAPAPAAGPAATAAPPGGAPSLQRKVVVYYFYNKIRCASCRSIERYTGEALRAFFAPQLASGEVEWRPVDLDEKGNERYAGDYQLFSKSVILSEVVGGREKGWRNLVRVWELTGDREGFHGYIRGEVQAVLDGKTPSR